MTILNWHTKSEYYHVLNDEVKEWAKVNVGPNWDLETTYTWIWFDGEEHLLGERAREKIIEMQKNHGPIPANHRRMYHLYQNYNHNPVKLYFTYMDVPADECYQKERR